MLKGGLLLAAYGARRPTRDIAFAALDVANDLDHARLGRAADSRPRLTASNSSSPRRSSPHCSAERPNTRRRDFVDIASLAGHDLDDAALAESVRRVAVYRQASIQPLRHVLAGYPRIAQDRWSAWRRKQRLTESTPAQFADLLDEVLVFAEPALERAETAP